MSFGLLHSCKEKINCRHLKWAMHACSLHSIKFSLSKMRRLFCSANRFDFLLIRVCLNGKTKETKIEMFNANCKFTHWSGKKLAHLYTFIESRATNERKARKVANCQKSVDYACSEMMRWQWFRVNTDLNNQIFVFILKNYKKKSQNFCMPLSILIGNLGPKMQRTLNSICYVAQNIWNYYTKSQFHIQFCHFLQHPTLFCHLSYHIDESQCAPKTQ